MGSKLGSGHGGRVANKFSGLRFEQVRRWEDVRASFRLLHENYRQAGLTDDNRSGLRFSHFNLLREAATYAVKAGGQVVATLSLVVDSDSFGLPMDKIYRREVEHLRRRGRRVAEITGLAVSARFRRESMEMIVGMVQLLARRARALGVTDLLLACHPRHARLYRRICAFEVLGDLRSYGSVNNAPAVALTVDVEQLRAAPAAQRKSWSSNPLRLFDRLQRRPGARCRTGFSSAVVRRLCALQPETARQLEARCPGLVQRLTRRRCAPQLQAHRSPRSVGALRPVLRARRGRLGHGDLQPQPA